MIQRRPPPEPPESPYSSPTTASPGRSSASRARTARSTAVSASVTGVRSGLVSTTRSAARKRASVIESARSASSSASARSSDAAAIAGPDPTRRAARLPVSMAANDLERETTDLLRELVRFNTVNPPGNERAAIEFLAGYLNDAGLKTELLADDEDRPNLVADLTPDSPDDTGPTMVYLGHVDTVLADPSEWQHDPWSGDVADGFLWGRGALDMKSQVAAEAVG